MEKSEIIQIIKEELKLLERELTDKELKRRDKIADELPDAEFKKRYGKDYKSVKYATATKMAKREENDPEDGKAAPHGSGYNVVKEYNIQALRSLRKVVTEGELTEAHPLNKVIGGYPVKYEGEPRNYRAIITEPMNDRQESDMIKRAKKAGYRAKPNMGGGVTIFVKEGKVNEDY